mmetsp:Transcript_8159/g.26759  ORF Transcript_8159/g.26759 Transcript_8159/m.26759 type:complete len:336 (-) Transcript_8159:34-1041(-)
MEKVGLVWLHGLGDEPKSWTVMQQLLRPRFAAAGFDVEWAVPEAPYAPVSMQGKAILTSWFDWYHHPIAPNCQDDRRGTLLSVDAVLAAIEKMRVPKSRVVVGGFSQGGALALNVVFRSPQKLAGCAVMSGWLPLLKDDLLEEVRKKKRTAEDQKKKPKTPPKKKTAAERLEGFQKPVPEHPFRPANLTSPVFWGHGVNDDVVLHCVAEDAQKLLLDAGVPITAADYHIRHVSHPDEIDDLLDFLVKTFTRACAEEKPTNTPADDKAADDKAAAAETHAPAAPPPPPLSSSGATPPSDPPTVVPPTVPAPAPAASQGELNDTPMAVDHQPPTRAS